MKDDSDGTGMTKTQCAKCHLDTDSSQCAFYGFKFANLTYVFPLCSGCAAGQNESQRKQFKFSLLCSLTTLLIFVLLLSWYENSPLFSPYFALFLIIILLGFLIQLIFSIHSPFERFHFLVLKEGLEDERCAQAVCLNHRNPAFGRCALCLKAFCKECFHYTINGSLYCDECADNLTKYFKRRSLGSLLYMAFLATTVLTVYFLYNIDMLIYLAILPCMILSFLTRPKLIPANEKYYEKVNEGFKISEEFAQELTKKASETQKQ
ncbi:MAG: hypothetical protein QXL15_03805 [Candidatus Korarchaeota archaeon]